MTNLPDHPVTKALQEGERRSREIAAPPVREPAHVALWRRHKWKIIAALFLILTELCLTMLGGTIALGPQ